MSEAEVITAFPAPCSGSPCVSVSWGCLQSLCFPIIVLALEKPLSSQPWENPRDLLTALLTQAPAKVSHLSLTS